MESILQSESLSLARLRPAIAYTASIHHIPCQFIYRPVGAGSGSCRSSGSVVSAAGTLTANSFTGNWGKLKLQLDTRGPTRKFRQPCALVVRCDYPQNADFPRHYSKKEKKPFPVPVVELRRAARERVKKSRGQPKKPVPPPKNGLVVKSLVPTAYDVLNARVTLINNLKELLKVVKVHACR